MNDAQQELHIEVEGRRIRLSPGQRLTLGRDRAADVPLANADVSRRHAEIRHENGSWQLRDLDSSNGTWVGGHRVRGYVALRGGESVRLGGERGVPFRVGISAAPAERTGSNTSATEHAGTGPVSAPMPRAKTSSGDTQATHTGGPTAASGPLPRAAAPANHDGSGVTTTGPIRLPRPPRAPEQRRATGDVFQGWSGQVEPQPTGRMTVQGAAPQAMDAPTGTITIGRGLENEIVIKDLLASRQHVRLVPQGDSFAVEDLGSRNGTYINGARIHRGTLREDDLLAVGRTRFTLKQGRLVASEDEGDVSFVANHLSFVLPDGKKLLDDVSFGLEGSSLVAVIGPSGAGKSTLLKALIGAQKATEGEVYYDGRDLYDNYEDLRHRIGVVPQDDVVHPELTVRQALRYAAELRFPDDLDKEPREERVEEVIDELGLTAHADTQVARLSGGQRKRTSVALELLTRPSLLFLDEPTSGLDPGLDKRVMLTLRGLADGGRTVVVITHNVASLGVCDRVLMLAPGGKVAFFGPPEEMLPFFSASDHADVFNTVTDDPERSQDTFRRSALMDSHVSAPLSAPRSPASTTEDKAPRQQTIGRQLSTLIRRQFRVIAADRGFVGFMLLLPIALAGLAMLVPGSHGLHTVFFEKEVAAAGGDPSKVTLTPESSQIMTLIVMGSVFMGLAATIRELVAERPIFLREKAVGLSPFAYIGSKAVTYGLLIAVQCGVMVALVILGKGAPDAAVTLGSPILETYLIAFLTGLAAVGIGLALSSFAKTNEQVMPMLVIVIMGALVFSGGLFDLNSAAMRAMGSIFPSRWGLALGAQTADVHQSLTIPGREREWDPFWLRDSSKWALGAAILIVQFVVAFLVALVSTRRRKSM